MNILGIALRALGARESGTVRLQEAVTVYRAALQERTRDRLPLDWAMTRGNLANVEIGYYDNTGAALHLDAADRHLSQAREVFEEAGAPQYVPRWMSKRR